MYEEFTRERIIQLRTQKDVSAREMSLAIGQNESYINRIENKRFLPSLQVLFWICDYFNITPQEFFNKDNDSPAELSALIDVAIHLDAKEIELVTSFASALVQKNH